MTSSHPWFHFAGAGESTNFLQAVADVSYFSMAAPNPAGSSSSSTPEMMFHQFLAASGGGAGLPDEPVSKRGKLEPMASKSKARKSSKDSGKPNPLISPTEKCKVCLEPAAKHIHYGAVTCFSCRAFFRRSIQNHSSENYKCRKEGHCDITMKARKSCQKCRFERCLAIGMKSSWVLSEEERYHRFRKQRERQKQQDGNGLLQPDQKEAFLMKDDYDHDDRYTVHSRNSHRSDDDLDQPHPHHHHDDDRDSSPGSSQGYGGIDSDTERSFHHYGPALSPNYVSPPPLSPPTHNSIKNDPDYGDPSHLHTFFSMDFLTKNSGGSSDPFLQFDLPPHNLLFPVIQPVPDDVLMREDSASSRLSIMHEGGHRSETRGAPPPPPRPASPPRASAPSPGPMRAQQVPEMESMSVDEPNVIPPPPPPPPVDRINNLLPPDLASAVTADEIAQIKAIARIHDLNYKSINFGEQLIKEMARLTFLSLPSNCTKVTQKSDWGASN